MLAPRWHYPWLFNFCCRKRTRWDHIRPVARVGDEWALSLSFDRRPPKKRLRALGWCRPAPVSPNFDRILSAPWWKLEYRVTDSEFRDVFHSHKDVLYRYAYRMTGSRAASEDVVQESFLALWRKPETYDQARGPVRAFLFGIARNLLLKSFRDQPQHEELDPESFVCAPFDVGGMERADAVAKALRMLPPLQREAVILAEYDEMTLEEIARAAHAEVAAVKSRLHRGRENLRRMLARLLESRGALNGPKPGPKR